MKYQTRFHAPVYAMADAPITFAGVPHNFAYKPNSVNGNPISPAALAVPEPATISKVYPGEQSNGTTNNTPGNIAAKSTSPLDEFAKLFDTTPVDPNAPAPTPTVLDATQANFAEAAKKLNFVKDIPADKLAAMQKGGAEGVAAMLEMINNVGQQAFAQAAATSTGITNEGFKLKSGDFDKQMREIQVQATAQHELTTLNPILLSPAFAPLTAQIQQKILEKNPTIQGKQLADKTVEYFKLMNASTTATPATPDTSNNGLKDFWNGIHNFNS